MAAKKRLVKWQNPREMTCKPFNGDKSPYWEYARRFQERFSASDHQTEVFESPLANPDLIAEAVPLEENRTRAALLAGVREIKFSPKEKAILELISRGWIQERVARELGLTRSRVAQALLRIRKKGEAYYKKIQAVER